MATTSARDQIEIRVEGMHCAGCVSKVQRELEHSAGVEDATVNLAAGRAVVRGSGLDIETLLGRIRAKGFDAEPLEEEASIQSQRTEIETRQARSAAMWKRRAILGLGIWIPLEALHWIAHVNGWDGQWMPIVMLAGSTVAMVLVGGGFYRSAWRAARNGTTNMDTLISIGATAAYVFSLVVFFAQLAGRLVEQPMYFAEAAALLGIISLGHWLEARASAAAGSAVRELLELQPDEVEIVDGDAARTIPSGDVQPGDRLLIRPGARVAVDGQVVEGASDVDESVVTGESVPVHKAVGDTVVAGAMNTTGRLIVEATVDGRHTTVARIAELVQSAQSSKADIQRLADRVSAVFVPAVLTIAAITVVGWWLAGSFTTGLIAMVTVLIISCPCALGLATPMAVMVGAGAASQRGILVKSASALETAGRVSHVVFDKTGTLTSGAMTVIAIEPVGSVAKDDLLRLAAAVEMPSEHPIAHAIVREAKDRGLDIPGVDSFQAIAGEGVRGLVDGAEVVVRRDAVTTCRVMRDGEVLGAMTVADGLREDALQALRELREMNLGLTLLTGDRAAVATEIGATLGLSDDQIIAEATPESKAETIAALDAQHEHMAMVGDGINDAAALARADLGIAMASGTNIAIESADVVITDNHVCAVPRTIRIARQTLRTIKQNLFFAFMYNVAAIPLAAFGMLGEHGPLIAAAAMGLSDVTVVGNALRLKWRLGRMSRDCDTAAAEI